MKSTFGALAVMLAVLCACQTAAPPAPLPRALEHATRIELPPPTGYAVSSDGDTLLFSAVTNGNLNVFTAPMEGGEPTALTTSAAADTSAVSYFPNDDRVLLSVGIHLYVRERDGALSNIGDGLQFLGWRADGGAFYTAGESLYVFNTINYARQTLLSTAGMESAVISRDGRWAAFGSNGGALFLADLSAPDPTPRRILADESAAHVLFEFAPSNRALIYGARAPNGFMQAHRYDLATGEILPAMESQANVLAITSSSTGRYGAYATGRNAVEDVVVIDQQTDRALPLSANTRDVRFNRDDTRVIFRLANDDWPQDVFAADLDGRNMQRVVHAPNARR